MDTQKLFENLRSELRRGTLVLAVLAQLEKEHYGYSLRKSLQSKGISVDESTLYPLVRRLESQGLLASEWREEKKRKKRFYHLSEDGMVVLKHLTEEWFQISRNLSSTLTRENNENN